jgi:hypothetical protein
LAIRVLKIITLRSFVALLCSSCFWINNAASGPGRIAAMVSQLSREIQREVIDEVCVYRFYYRPQDAR